jgi:thioredoxin reductase
VAVWSEPIKRLESEQDRLRRVVFGDGSVLERSAFFVHGTTRQASDLPARLGVGLLDDGAVEVDDLQHTSVAGVSAAGDLARRRSMPLPGSMVSIAMACGAVAAVGLDQDLLEANAPRMTSSPA